MGLAHQVGIQHRRQRQRNECGDEYSGGNNDTEFPKQFSYKTFHKNHRQKDGSQRNGCG
ncbi:hypothetical protein D3C87_1943370 [compost metagenome]